MPCWAFNILLYVWLAPALLPSPKKQTTADFQAQALGGCRRVGLTPPELKILMLLLIYTSCKLRFLCTDLCTEISLQVTVCK